MTTLVHRTNLTMSIATFDELYIRAQVPMPEQEANARRLRRALTASEATNGHVRVACCPSALAFIREAAPDLAAYWPAVFGHVDVPRSRTLSSIAEYGIGQTIAGLIVDREGLVRIAFESGDALLIGSDGSIEWEAAG